MEQTDATDPVFVYDTRRKVKWAVGIFWVGFFVMFLLEAITTGQLYGFLLIFDGILAIIFVVVYINLYRQYMVRLEFYETFVRCFRRTEDSVEISYPELRVELKSDGRGSTCVLSRKESENKKPWWKAPFYAGRKKTGMDLFEWLKSKNAESIDSRITSI